MIVFILLETILETIRCRGDSISMHEVEQNLLMLAFTIAKLFYVLSKNFLVKKTRLILSFL